MNEDAAWQNPDHTSWTKCLAQWAKEEANTDIGGRCEYGCMPGWTTDLFTRNQHKMLNSSSMPYVILSHYHYSCYNNTSAQVFQPMASYLLSMS